MANKAYARHLVLTGPRIGTPTVNAIDNLVFRYITGIYETIEQGQPKKITETVAMVKADNFFLDLAIQGTIRNGDNIIISSGPEEAPVNELVTVTLTFTNGIPTKAVVA